MSVYHSCLNTIYFRSLFIREFALFIKSSLFICVPFPDVFLGPVCEYVISPVAKYASVWNIPLITAAAQADGFTNKQPNYPLLTRMMGSYR